MNAAFSQIEKAIQERGLLVVGVDAQGNKVGWLAPELHDLRFYGRCKPHTDDILFERLGATNYYYSLRRLAKSLGLDLSEEELGDIKAQAIAGARRYAMKGEL